MPPRRKKRKAKEKGLTTAGNLILARMAREKAVLEETRDNLRAIASDANEMADNIDEALEQLQSASDTLSQYV